MQKLQISKEKRRVERSTPSRTNAYYHKAAEAGEGPKGVPAAPEYMSVLDRYITAVYWRRGRYQGSI
jgi:hypothetical protein